MTETEALAHSWVNAKNSEAQAQEARRTIEDKLAELLKINPEKDGTKTEAIGEFECKVTTRLSRKIDADMAQEIAAEYGLQDQLGIVFRWKPDLNLYAWKVASAETRTQLIKAITTTASRPSFAISLKTKD